MSNSPTTSKDLRAVKLPYKEKKSTVTACRAFWTDGNSPFDTKLSMVPIPGESPSAFYLVIKTGENEVGRWVSPEELGEHRLRDLDLRQTADYLLPIIALEKMFDPKACKDKWGRLLKYFQDQGLLDKQY
jgi:hypothetical protein